MQLTTERLILRPWQPSDAESLYEYGKDPDVGPIAGWPVHTSVENSLEIINTVFAEEETYAVCLKEDNRAIGSIGLVPLHQTLYPTSEEEIEVGYWIGKPFWGRGLIPEAVRRLQQHAFKDLGYTTMWCGYYDGNEKSKRVQEKCGFIYDHAEKDKPCTFLNEIRTEHFTKITKEQWEKNMKPTITDMTETNKTMTLTLEDDTLLQCAPLCKIEMEEGTFIILLPVMGDGEQDPDGDVYFFDYAEDENGEPILNSIETEEIYLKVADAFDAWLDEMEEKDN